MKRALLLEGGGAKGAYQAGAIKALTQKKIFFDAAGGTSIGAINAAFYASRELNKMYKLWLSLDSEELFNIDGNMLDNFHNLKFSKSDIKNGLSSIHQIIKNQGIDLTNIKKLLKQTFNEDKLRRSKIEYGLNTFNLSDFKPVEIFKKDIPKGKLADCILSSAYLPFFKLEKIIDDKYYLDGGVYLNCPIDMFINAGYDEIYVIRAWRKKLKYHKKEGVKIHIITPREDLGSIVRFTPSAAQYRMSLGYYDALKYLYDLDGNKYYFKKYSEEYYNTLFDKKTFKKIDKMYNRNVLTQSNKYFILKMIEKICKQEGIERFKIYNMPYLLTKLKFRMANKKDNKYYYFIKNIKIEFE